MGYNVYDVGGSLVESQTKIQSVIEPIWKDVFPEGEIVKTSKQTYLRLNNKISIMTLGYLPSPRTSVEFSTLGPTFMNAYFDADEYGTTKTNMMWPNVFEGFWGVSNTPPVVTDLSNNYLHVVVGKQKKTLAFGFSDVENRIVLNALVSKLEDNEYVGIQFRCMDEWVQTDTVPTNTNDIVNCRFDGYVKDFNTKSRTQFTAGCGLYTSSKILTIVPTMDPWRSVPIPDTYMSICGPLDMAGLDGKIYINNRTFVTGHVLSHEGSGKPSGEATMSDGGICTFIEI